MLGRLTTTSLEELETNTSSGRKKGGKREERSERKIENTNEQDQMNKRASSHQDNQFKFPYSNSNVNDTL